MYIYPLCNFWEINTFLWGLAWNWSEILTIYKLKHIFEEKISEPVPQPCLQLSSDLVEGDGPVEDLDPEEGDEDVGDHEIIVLPGRLIRSSSNNPYQNRYQMNHRGWKCKIKQKNHKKKRLTKNAE